MKSLHQIVLNEYFEPSAGRAVRVTLALILPLVWGMTTHHLEPAVWISITAQILSNISIQGSYPLKLLLLSGAVIACAVCGALGVLAGHHWVMASILMMILAFLGGFVRQSGNYGPGVTVGVLLMYLLTMDHPGNFMMAEKIFFWMLTGGLIALLLTLLAWAFVPFSPFRRSIALTWKALGEWLETFSLKIGTTSDPVTILDEKELLLRNELANSMEILSRKQALSHAMQNRYSYRLVELRRMVSEAGNVVSSLQTLIEPLISRKEFPDEPFRNTMEILARAANRIALSIITHRPEDVYASRLSIEKSRQYIKMFLKESENPSLSLSLKPVSETFQALIQSFESAQTLIERAIPPKGNMTFFLRNFLTGITIPQQVPWVRFEFSSRSFTFRYALRLALGMGIGVAVYKYFNVPHGYWIAMTVMIIMQPEFGATFKKAFQRMKGTILGVMVGSLLFLLHLPLLLAILIVTVCSFLMTWYLLRNYAVAAFFITMMVIALFHLIEPVTWQLGGIRLINTIAGCGLAMLGGFAFWPLWEKYRFPALLNKAVSANRSYLYTITNALAEGKEKTFNNFVKVRREAEMNNNNAFLSLRRMKGEPDKEQQHIGEFFILAGQSVRITRFLNTINRQIIAFSPHRPVSWIEPYSHKIDHLLKGVENILDDQSESNRELSNKNTETNAGKNISADDGKPSGDYEEIVASLMDKITVEAGGMYQTVKNL